MTCAPVASAWTSRSPSASRSRSRRASGRRCAGTGEVYFDSIAMFVFLLLGGPVSRARGATSRRAGRSPTSRGSRRRSPNGCGFPGSAVDRAGRCGVVAPGRHGAGEARRNDRRRRHGRRGRRRRGRGAPDRRERAAARRTRAAGSSAVRSTWPSRWSSGSSASGSDTVLAGIVRLVERAMSERQPLVELADRYAHWFVLAAARRGGGDRDRLAPCSTRRARSG